jgi:hypothetical protein
MTIRPLRRAGRGGFVGTRVLTALGIVATLIFTASAQASDEEVLSVRIGLDKEAFMRGGTDPVADLKVNVTLTNLSDKIELVLPLMEMDPQGIVEFEIALLGAPTGVIAADETPEKTPILRNPAIQPVDTIPPVPGISIPPSGSKQVTLNVGGWYDIKAAGKYEMTCVFSGAQLKGIRSNTIEFEVLPIKRIDVPAHDLIANLGDYERDNPDYPFMFYITRGPGRFDNILYLTREGKGGYEHYEYHWLGQISPDKLPEMKTSGSRVALVVPDKTNDNVSWTYEVDFAKHPIVVKGEKVVHEPGSIPQVSLD